VPFSTFSDFPGLFAVLALRRAKTTPEGKACAAGTLLRPVPGSADSSRHGGCRDRPGGRGTSRGEEGASFSFPFRGVKWHSVGMATGNRQSRMVALASMVLAARGDELRLPGNAWKLIEEANAPTVKEFRLGLLGLRARLGWSRSMLSAFLGVGKDTLRRWESGERNPSGAARRLIWLVGRLVGGSAQARDGLDLVFWVSHATRR